MTSRAKAIIFIRRRRDRSSRVPRKVRSKEGYDEPNSETRQEPEREMETKLILSSQAKGWNISENLIGVILQ